jgi:hypothetical protein
VFAVGVAGTGAVGTTAVTISVNAYPLGVTAYGYAGQVMIWGDIVPSQNPSWNAITPSESPGWTVISPATSSSWTPIAPSEDPGYTPITPSQSPNWTQIAA